MDISLLIGLADKALAMLRWAIRRQASFERTLVISQWGLMRAKDSRYWVLRCDVSSRRPVLIEHCWLDIYRGEEVRRLPHLSEETIGSSGTVPLSNEAFPRRWKVMPDEPTKTGAFRFYDHLSSGAPIDRVDLVITGKGKKDRKVLAVSIP